MRGVPQHYFFGPRVFFGGISFLLLLFILGLLVYLVVLVRSDRDRARPAARQADPPPAPSPALLTATEVLKMRYARGEIGREEYETIRRDLG
ncbi:MAG TPA: SHOCT domain-containing protein [Actinomycetota bacterium]|jgi:uncharacterized membrane protein|nr:SHOCT domain-containing protein [Actinomycetota bacterium]